MAFPWAAAIQAGMALASAGSNAAEQARSGGGGSRVERAPLAKRSKQLQFDQLKELENMIKAGPNAEDSRLATESSRQFADDLARVREQGLRPSEQDFGAARIQMAPRRAQLDQAFEDANVQQQRLAAQLNRPINDPILQAKLQQERIRQENQFGADMGAAALQNAGQRLSFSEALSNVRQGLASQAFQNRMQLTQLGQGILRDARNFKVSMMQEQRLRNAGKSGRIGGGITGAIGGLGSANKLIKGFGGGDASAEGGGGLFDIFSNSGGISNASSVLSEGGGDFFDIGFSSLGT